MFNWLKSWFSGLLDSAKREARMALREEIEEELAKLDSLEAKLSDEIAKRGPDAAKWAVDQLRDKAYDLLDKYLPPLK
jgi:hypothetical protein